MFGYVVSLNYNKNGDTHKTLFGGVVSVIVKAAFLVFIAFNIKKLIYYEDNKIKQFTEKFDPDQVVLLKESRVQAMTVLLDASNGNRAIKYDQEVKRYLRIKYKQIEMDLTSNLVDIRVTRELDSRTCQKDDFFDDFKEHMEKEIPK